MRGFTYTQKKEVGDAIHDMMHSPEAKFIAGGTNLIDLMREGVERPARLIDIKGLPFHSIEDNAHGGLRLGAFVTNADTSYNEQVIARYPLLSKAILAGASPQLRNMATNGGNLLQRTRCYYFYDTATPCNKREPGSGCSAINGYNRIHAILGTSEHCIATHPSDMCIALAALEATINVRGPEGERSIPFVYFHRLPEDAPQDDNNLRFDEIITSIDLPEKGFEKHYYYLKVRDRASYAFALVSVAVGLELEGDIVKEARIALGGVAHKPWKQSEAEHWLKDKRCTDENFEVAAGMIIKGAIGYTYNNFKIELAKRSIVRALQEAVKMEDNL
jgi:xanthine dehydrogenase YagS FAD-binding subunit